MNEGLQLANHGTVIVRRYIFISPPSQVRTGKGVTLEAVRPRPRPGPCSLSLFAKSGALEKGTVVRYWRAKQMSPPIFPAEYW